MEGDARVVAQRDRAWVGIDVGKTHHWAGAVDAAGKNLLSVKFANDEAEIVAFLADAAALAKHLVCASTSSVRRLHCCSRCWLELAKACGMPRVVAATSAAYVGQGKTDAKDAYVIAETARLRQDLAMIGADIDLIRDRLVEHQRLRLQRERAGDADALPLAAGELVRVAVAVLGVQPDLP